MRDADNALYIDTDGDISTTNDILGITDEWGGSPTFDYQDSWSGNSHKSESIAIELQADDSYKLAIKKTDNWGDGDHINWEVLSTDSNGVIDWNKSTWGGITKHEDDFKQDLNGDGGIGLSAALTSINTDTTGSILKRDLENSLYIDIDGDSSTSEDIIPIADEYGGYPSFNHQNSWNDSWGNHTHKEEAIAAEIQEDGSFKLAIRFTNTYQESGSDVIETNINWSIYSLDSDGLLDWDNSSWGAIAEYESYFNQDLNGDGGLGLAASLSTVETDLSGSVLRRDESGSLYIDVDGDQSTSEDLIRIQDEFGYSPSFNHSNSWSDNWGSGSHLEEVVAVEKQANDAFKIAIKHTNSWTPKGSSDVEMNIDWNVLSLNSSGIIDWDTSYWGGIAKFEADFNQDLNGDGGIGLSASLTTVSSDNQGSLLRRNTENMLYIDVDGDANTTADLIGVVDQWGGAPVFDHQDNWADQWGTGSNVSEAIAVEKQGDGTYKLAIKYTNIWNSDVNVDWNVYTVDSNGILSWDNVERSFGVNSISKYEKYFNADLNADGAIGLKLDVLTSDTTGASLKRDSSTKYLYIDIDPSSDTDALIPVTDKWGGAPVFDYENTWDTDSKHVSEAFAVEKLSNGDFRLAIKKTDTWGTGGEESNVEWEVLTLSSAGVINPDNIKWGKIAKFENDFNQDLNLDGQQGLGELVSSNGTINLSALTKKSTESSSETDNAALHTDAEGSLYIVLSDESNTVIPITDSFGESPSLDQAGQWTDRWGSGSFKSETFAVEKQTDGSFKLAVKNTNTVKKAGESSATSEIDWNVYSISTLGQIDWFNVYAGSISKQENLFNQDLNEDSVIGLKLNSVSADIVGARLKMDETNSLYIDQDGDDSTSNDILAVTDEFGGAPVFDYTETYSGAWGSNKITQESVAVNKVGADYKLAIKYTSEYKEGDNDVVTTSDWNIYTIDSTGNLDWSSSTWGSIVKHEDDFGQDLNGDGGTGLSAALVNEDLDTSGEKLKRDSTNALYIVSAAGVITPIVDQWGGAPILDHEDSWSNAKETNTFTEKPVAVERQTDGTYKLAVKRTHKRVQGSTEELIVDWNVYTVDNQGVLDWGSATWDGITKHEVSFGQDLNLDGTTGVSYSKVSTDTTTGSSTLQTDLDGYLYIDVNDNGTNILPILDSNSENIAFNYSDKWADAWGSGSFTESPIAVEQQADGSYKLAIKNIHQWAFGSEATQTEIDWNVYDISSSGFIDWNSATYGGITKYEDYFNQDLNGDGGVGINASLTTVSTDTTGAKLKIDPDNALYIDDNGTLINILDQWGDAPRLDDSGTWSDRWSTNAWTQESVAVERQSDGSYKLAVKTTNVRNKDRIMKNLRSIGKFLQ